ncbi:gypsy type transposase, partial [Tanacetum coccineum]
SLIFPFGNGKYESNDSTIQQLFIRYGALCARKQIQVTNVLLIDVDVSKALVDYVSENEIENLVLGASTRSGITRFLERRLATRTLVNLSAPPKITLSSEPEDETRSATISQRSAPDMIMPHIRDAYETPSPVYFGSVDLVGHDLDVNFMGHSNENRTLASSSPEEVHPQLPGPNDTMHERPAGKVGMYTRFFDYTNYLIPFSLPYSVIPINGWFGFTKRPNVRACYSKNLDSVKNWNNHFFWVDEFVVPANARFNWFSGSNVSKDLAPTAFEYNAKHASILITHASPFLRFSEEFLCWMDLNDFIRTADPRKVRIVERARAENEEPIVTVAKHRTVTLLPTSFVRPSGELSASIEREFVGDAGGCGGGEQEIASVGSHGNVEPILPTTDNVVSEIEAPGLRRSKKKRVTHGSEGIPAASHPPKRLRADYGTTGGSAVRGKSPSVLNRLLQDSLLMVEQGVSALPTLPFITSSVTASPLEEGGDHTDSVTGAKSADSEVDSFVRSVALVMTTATTITAFISSVAATATTYVDIGKDKDVSAPSIFSCSSSSDKTDRTLSLFTGKSGSEFVAGSIRAGGDADVDLQEIYIPEWSVTKGFELNDGRSCANMIDHFTPPAFFKTVRGILSSEVRMRAGYNILEKKKWKSLPEEKDNLLLEAIEGSLRGKVASAKEHNGLLEQEHSALKLKMTSLESIIAEKDRELSDLGTSASSLRCMSWKLPLQENFHLHLLNAIARRRWLLTHGMKLLMAKCLNSTKYMEALGNAFGRAIEKGMQEGLAAGIEHGLAGRCLSDLEAYNPFAEADFNSAVCDLRGLDFLLLWDLSSTRRGVRKMERNLAERLPFLKDVFVSIDYPISAEALAILPETSTEPPITALITTALSTMVIRPNSDPFLLVKDYENPDLAGVVLEDVIPGPEGEGKVEGSTKGDV